MNTLEKMQAIKDRIKAIRDEADDDRFVNDEIVRLKAQLKPIARQHNKEAGE